MLALLLNWRVWAAIIAFSVVVSAGIGGYKYGRNNVQEQFNAYKTQQLQDAVEQQKLVAKQQEAMQTSNQKVSDNYVLKSTSTSTAISELARLRQHQQSSSSSIVSQSSPAASSPDDGAKDGVLAECRDRRDQLAGEAQQLSDQVTGLQSYIRDVVQNGTK